MTTESKGSKRKRGVNFTPREYDLLLSIICKYKHIIENKETNALKSLEKNKTWEKICAEFNAQSVDFLARSTEQLKKFYENKREVKKKKAEERMETLKTGGGPPPPGNNEDLILSIMDPLIVKGDCNEFDSNRVKSISNLNSQDNNPNSNAIELLLIYCDGDDEEEPYEAVVVESEGEQDQQDDLQSSSVDVTPKNLQNTWKKYVPRDLKKPLNPALIRPRYSKRGDEKTDYAATSIEIIDIAEENGGRINEHTDASSSETPGKYKKGNGETGLVRGKGRDRVVVSDRRRPRATTVVRSLASSALAEKYNELADKKNILADHAIQKIASKKLYEQKEHELRCRSMDLDILIKKKQLEKLSKI